MSEPIELGASDAHPLRLINSAAPIRICDNGGWTDTWFAGHGKIFNIAVAPCVEVQVAVYPRAERAARVMLHAENYGDRYALAPGDWSEARASAARHPLLEAAVAEMAPPEEYALEITIYSAVPAGCSTGTSAAVTVALLGALDALTPGRMTPHEIAYAAHRIEVERLHLQSGIQDQLCSAYGGLSFIDMYEKETSRFAPKMQERWSLYSLPTRSTITRTSKRSMNHRFLSGS